MPRLALITFLTFVAFLAAWAAPAQAAGPLSSLPDAWQPRDTAELTVLDKVRAQPSPLTVRVGQSVSWGSLTITVRGCVVRPPDVPQDSAAFLEVTDGRSTGTAFHGWMLASAPALSLMEHPIYDLRVTSCH